MIWVVRLFELKSSTCSLLWVKRWDEWEWPCVVLCFRQILDHYTNMYPQLIQNPKTLVAVKRFMAWVSLSAVCVCPVFAPCVCVDSVCGVAVSRTSGLGVRWRVTPRILCGFTRAWFWHSWTGCRPESPTGPNNRAGRCEASVSSHTGH